MSRHILVRDLVRGTRVVLAGLVVLALAGCARKMPPSGGPPDLVEPFVRSVIPDSGSTAVDRTGAITIEFSEGMDPRSTLTAVEIAPRVDWKSRHWSGRKLELVPKDSLRANQTYTVFVGLDARDWHGNSLKQGRTVPFTTAVRFPPGRIAGKIEATGFVATGTYLWCYPDSVAPDSTGRDFEAVGLAGDLGDFQVNGLHVPGRYRLWAFADLNHNHSFEPSSDLLTPADTTFQLTSGRAIADGVVLHVTNPRAPGRVKGTVLDTLNDNRGSIRLIVQSYADTTRRLLYDLEASGAYDLQWEPGRYRVRAIRDFDRNKIWKRDEEPGSDEIDVTVPPGGEVSLPPFILVRARPAGTSP